MNKKLIFKGFALLNAVTLVTLFLSYRSGAFDDFLYNNNTKNSFTSHNGGAPAVQVSNTMQATPEVQKAKIRFSSSKSMVISENETPTVSESKRKADSIYTDWLKHLDANFMIAASSKSMMVLSEKDFGSLDKYLAIPIFKQMMYSSKSGKIFDASQLLSLSANTIKNPGVDAPKNTLIQNSVPSEQIEQSKPPKEEKKISKSSALGMDKDFIIAASSKSMTLLSEKDQALWDLAKFEFNFKTVLVNLFNTNKKPIYWRSTQKTENISKTTLSDIISIDYITVAILTLIIGGFLAMIFIPKQDKNNQSQA